MLNIFRDLAKKIHQILAQCEGTYVPDNDKLNLYESRLKLNDEIKKRGRYIVTFD